MSYLQRRGHSEWPLLFLRVTAPAGPLSNDAVRGVVHDACERAGVAPVGAHRLRHTAATGMLRKGASLPEIAQVLRTARPRPQRSTRKSTAPDSGRSRSRGQEHGHDRSALAMNDYLTVRRQLGFQLGKPDGARGLRRVLRAGRR